MCTFKLELRACLNCEIVTLELKVSQFYQTVKLELRANRDCETVTIELTASQFCHTVTPELRASQDCETVTLELTLSQANLSDCHTRTDSKQRLWTAII